MPPVRVTAHDLAADWAWMDEPGNVGFRLRGGRVVWEEAAYGRSAKVRIGRILVTSKGLRPVFRYVDPDTLVELVSKEKS